MKTISPLLLKILQKNLNQKEVARQCNIAEGTLSMICTGVYKPSAAQKRALASMLRCDTKELFFE